ncbi:hypothetical protein C9975_09735 [Thalassospira xiamenensis]|nr:hypothetical protein C9975_09735 [Thalassospira xiamenensis]
MTGDLMSATSKPTALKGFSRRLKQRRRSLMLDTKVLAKRLGMKPCEYNQLELGNQHPDRKTLLKISLELRTSETWLVSGGHGY